MQNAATAQSSQFLRETWLVPLSELYDSSARAVLLRGLWEQPSRFVTAPLDFACDVVAVGRRMSRSPGIHVIANQLVKSATSIGANLEEAKAATSRREFARFVDISLREAREAHYWLRFFILNSEF